MFSYRLKAGGVRHDPRRFMRKTVHVPHFNRDTIECLSWERWSESKPVIKTLRRFLKNITEESDLENFQDLIVALDACYLLHKAISTSLSPFGDDLRCDFSRFEAAISCFSEDFMYCLALSLYVYFYLRVKELCSSYLNLFPGSVNKEQGEKSCVVSHSNNKQ